MSELDHIQRTRFGRLYHGQTAIDFYGRRRVGLIVAVVVVVVTVLSLFTRGLNLGLDFEGGEAWDIPASEEFGVDEAVDVLDENGISTAGAKVQRRTSESSDVVTVQLEVLPRETSALLTEEFAAAAGVETQDISFSFTSATWGGEITDAAVRALVIFLIIVSIFISLRFEWRMAVAALAAMAHDVVITVGVYSVFQFEVTPATVIAFLTILGYSLYDTIVVFDRIKENEGKYASVRMPYEDVVNISMNQVLMRSINTSLSSLLPVLSILVIGSGLLGATTLREFGLALFVGMLSGVYSSIFVASPLLATLKRSSGRTVRRERLTGDGLRAAVVGMGMSGRIPAEMRRRRDADGDETADSSGDRDLGEDADLDGDVDDDVHTAAVMQSADRLLTHPPRPRKKRKR